MKCYPNPKCSFCVVRDRIRNSTGVNRSHSFHIDLLALPVICRSSYLIKVFFVFHSSPPPPVTATTEATDDKLAMNRHLIATTDTPTALPIALKKTHITSPVLTNEIRDAVICHVFLCNYDYKITRGQNNLCHDLTRKRGQINVRATSEQSTRDMFCY